MSWDGIWNSFFIGKDNWIVWWSNRKKLDEIAWSSRSKRTRPWSTQGWSRTKCGKFRGPVVTSSSSMEMRRRSASTCGGVLARTDSLDSLIPVPSLLFIFDHHHHHHDMNTGSWYVLVSSCCWLRWCFQSVGLAWSIVDHLAANNLPCGTLV
jgi:hypothetical protein